MTAALAAVSGGLNDASYTGRDQQGDPVRRRCATAISDCGSATTGCRGYGSGQTAGPASYALFSGTGFGRRHRLERVLKRR